MQEVRAIRVLLAREGEYWVAQCLEYDVGAQARNLDELRKRFIVALEEERQESIRRHGKPFAGIGPAPAYFHRLWDQRDGLYTPKNPTALSDDPTLDIEFGVAA